MATSSRLGTHLRLRFSLAEWIARHWFSVLLTFTTIVVLLPILAPLLMHWGWERPARAIYFFYSFFCHQLPERSFFLFGEKLMYSLSEIQVVWQNTSDPLLLRQFIGNPQMGWKVAWSDRMVAMYTPIPMFVVLWRALLRHAKPLRWWGFFLLLFPLAVDGTTHFISDLAGIEQGFRENNQWLAILTHQALPADFYAGNALGSFNSWMRLLSGLLFALAFVWFVFPYLKQAIEGET